MSEVSQGLLEMLRLTLLYSNVKYRPLFLCLFFLTFFAGFACRFGGYIMASPDKPVTEASKRSSKILKEDRHSTSKKESKQLEKTVTAAPKRRPNNSKRRFRTAQRKKERKCKISIFIFLSFDPSRHLIFGQQRKIAF